MSLKSKTIDFVGIGFPKSATSWLTEVLDSHPGTYIPPQKELWFFLTKKVNDFGIMPNNNIKNLGWYFKQFKGADSDQLLGEYTPTYIYDYNGLLKLRTTFPDVKVIVIIRNPTDLICSQYYYMKTSISDKIDFRIDDIFITSHGQSLLNYGKIGKHLKTVFEIFNKSNIFVRTTDQIKENNKLFIQDLCDFLKIDQKLIGNEILQKRKNEARTIRFDFLHKLSQTIYYLFKMNELPLPFYVLLFGLYNKINRPNKEKQLLSTELKIKLNNYYYEEVEEVEKLLNIELFSWKTT